MATDSLSISTPDMVRWVADALVLRSHLDISWAPNRYVGAFPDSGSRDPSSLYRLVRAEGTETTTEGFESAEFAAMAVVHLVPRGLLVNELQIQDKARLLDEEPRPSNAASLNEDIDVLRASRATMEAMSQPPEPITPDPDREASKKACIERLIQIFSQGGGVSGVTVGGYKYMIRPSAPCFRYLTGPMWSTPGQMTARLLKMKDGRTPLHRDYAEHFLTKIGLGRTILACDRAEQELKEKG